VESTSATAPARNLGGHYVARQPILSSNEEVFGYELLFRDGVEDYFQSPDSDAASRSTVDTSILMGLDILCDGRRAFINCTRETLLKDYVTLLPAGQVVVEIVESVPADDLVKAACVRLKQAGYTIALDNFVVDDPRQELTKFADVIKLDIKSTSLEQQRVLIKRHNSPSCRMLAARVETRDDFTTCVKEGFSYFQGYFFRRPEMLHAREIPKNRVNYLRLLQAISEAEIEFKVIDGIIKGEPSLCYRLLRYLNSAAFGFSSEIQSVKHGLSILGEREVRRWVRMVAALGAGQDKPSDLVLSAMVRARYCELLEAKVSHGQSDLFLFGLLSLMDAILEIPMGVVLEGISLDRETRAVLLGQKSQLDLVYRLMLAQEAADWPKLSELCALLNLPESFATECYWKAMQWAREMTAGA
jgi:EAL and modified HD-GYP domain-containing signal transduction protein